MNKDSPGRRVHFFARIQRLIDILQELFFFLFIVSIFLAVLIPLDLLLNFGLSFRFFLLFFLFFYLLWVCSSRLTPLILKKLSLTGEAVYLDTFLDTGDLLINFLELSSAPSSPFTDQLKKETVSVLKKSAFFKCLRLKKIKKSFFQILPFLAVLIFSMIFIPKGTLVSVTRLLMPWNSLEERLYAYRYSVSPGHQSVRAGEDLVVSLSSEKKLKEAFIRFRSSERDFQSVRMDLFSENTNGYIYSYTFREVGQDFEYSVRLLYRERNHTASSPLYQISVIYPPLITGLQITYNYPSYTGLRKHTQKNSGNIETYRGTSVLIQASVNRLLQEAVIYFSGSRQNMTVRGKTAFIRFQVRKNDSYSIRITDRTGIQNSDPVEYRIFVLDDLPPEIRFTRPGEDREINDSMRFPMEIRAQDDIRIQSLELFYFVQRFFSDDPDPTNVLSLPITPSDDVTSSFMLDLQTLNLVPGDEVLYFAETFDGYPWDDSHHILTPLYTIRFPTLMDLYEKVDQKEDELIEKMENLLEGQTEFMDRLDEIKEKMEKGEELSFMERKQMESLLKKEENLFEQARELSSEMQETIDKVRENRMNDQAIIEKMQEIQKLVDQVADRDMREAMQELEKALEKVSLQEEDLEKLSQSLNQEELIRKLDNTLEMLQELKRNRQRDSLLKKTEELIRKQSEINEETASLDDNADKDEINKLKKKQDQNRENLKDLQDSMKETADSNQDDPEFSEEINKLSENMKSKNTEQKMHKASSEMEKQNFSEASCSQNSAMNDLMELQQSLQSSIDHKQKQDTGKMLALLDEIILNLLSVSREQNELIGSVTGLITKTEDLFASPLFSSSEPAGREPLPSEAVFLSEQEIFLERNLQKNRQRFQSDTEKIMFIPEEFYDQWDIISSGFMNTKKYLEERNYGQALNHSRQSYSLLNQLILQLLQTRDNMASQMQGQGQQGSSGSMDQITRSQQGLNSSTQRLKGEIPSQGMSPSQQQYLKELAYQQQMIGQSFQNLLQNEEQEGKLLGDGKSLSEEMEAISEKMQNGELDQELIDRQKELMKKLLDSQKSLQTRERSRQREAEHPDSVYPAVSPHIPEGSLNKRDKESFYRNIESFPEEYREIIQNYLNKIFSTDGP